MRRACRRFDKHAARHRHSHRSQPRPSPPCPLPGCCISRAPGPAGATWPTNASPPTACGPISAWSSRARPPACWRRVSSATGALRYARRPRRRRRRPRARASPCCIRAPTSRAIPCTTCCSPPATRRAAAVAITPYLVPDEALLQALCLAARRGVAMRLILPARSNHRLADWVRARALRELAASGAAVRLVPGAMVHAKALLFDDTLGIVGSANLDIRSLFLNFELVLLLRQAADIVALDAWCARLDARAIDARLPPAGALREATEGLVLLAAFQI
ncbi:MAG: phospholipase D-like domain-containing protein [Pseudomonadota bacterium]